MHNRCVHNVIFLLCTTLLIHLCFLSDKTCNASTLNNRITCVEDQLNLYAASGLIGSLETASHVQQRDGKCYVPDSSTAFRCKDLGYSGYWVKSCAGGITVLEKCSGDKFEYVEGAAAGIVYEGCTPSFPEATVLGHPSPPIMCNSSMFPLDFGVYIEECAHGVPSLADCNPSKCNPKQFLTLCGAHYERPGTRLTLSYNTPNDKEKYNNYFSGICQDCSEDWARSRCSDKNAPVLVECGTDKSSIVNLDWTGTASGQCKDWNELDATEYCGSDFMGTLTDNTGYYFNAFNENKHVVYPYSGDAACGRCEDVVCDVGETLIGCGNGRYGVCTSCTLPTYLAEEYVGVRYEFMGDECNWSCLDGWTGYDCNDECSTSVTCDSDEYLQECTASRDTHCANWVVSPPASGNWVLTGESDSPHVKNAGFDDFFFYDRTFGLYQGITFQMSSEQSEGVFIKLPNVHYDANGWWTSDGTVNLRNCIQDVATRDSSNVMDPHQCDAGIGDKYITVQLRSSRSVSLRSTRIISSFSGLVDNGGNVRRYSFWARKNDDTTNTVNFEIVDGSFNVESSELTLTQNNVELERSKWTLIEMEIRMTSINKNTELASQTLTLKMTSNTIDCEIALDEISIQNIESLSALSMFDATDNNFIQVVPYFDSDTDIELYDDYNGGDHQSTFSFHSRGSMVFFIDLEVKTKQENANVEFILYDVGKGKSPILGKVQVNDNGRQLMAIQSSIPASIDPFRSSSYPLYIIIKVLDMRARYISSGVYRSSRRMWGCSDESYLSSHGRSCSSCGLTHSVCPNETSQRLESCTFKGLYADRRCVDCPRILDAANEEYHYVANNPCSIHCVDGYVRNSSGHCEPCNSDAGTCIVGEYLSLCTQSQQSRCVPCTSITRLSTGFDQAYYSTSGAIVGVDSCEISCVTGYYRSGNGCFKCTENRVCYNQYLLPCSSNHDSQCIDCGEIGENRRVVSASPIEGENCVTRCIPGYYDCTKCSNALISAVFDMDDFEQVKPRIRDKYKQKTNGRYIKGSQVTFATTINGRFIYIPWTRDTDPYYVIQNGVVHFAFKNDNEYAALWISVPVDVLDISLRISFQSAVQINDGEKRSHYYIEKAVRSTGWWNIEEDNGEIVFDDEKYGPLETTTLDPIDTSAFTDIEITHSIRENEDVVRMHLKVFTDTRRAYINIKNIQVHRIKMGVNDDCLECDRHEGKLCLPCGDIAHPHESETFTTYDVTDDKTVCNWRCLDGFKANRTGMSCVACGPISCPVGEYQSSCGVCSNCTLPPNAVFNTSGGEFRLNKGADGTLDEEITSGPGSCEYSCMDGAWKDDEGNCTLCSNVTCIEGETWHKPCEQTSDAECIPCTTTCEPGFERKQNCTVANDTVCGACEGSPPTLGEWESECNWKCNDPTHTYRHDTHTCFKCEPKCDIGFYSVNCTEETEWNGCRVCLLPKGRVVVLSSGTFQYGCQWRCEDGYYYNGKDTCLPVESPVVNPQTCGTDIECPLGEDGVRDTRTGECKCSKCTGSLPSGTAYVHECEWGCIAPRIRNGDTCVMLTVAGEVVVGADELELSIELAEAVGKEPDTLLILGILLPVAAIMLLVSIVTLFPRTRRGKHAFGNKT